MVETGAVTADSSTAYDQIDVSVLIIGAGAAGARSAIELAKQGVSTVTSSSPWVVNTSRLAVDPETTSPMGGLSRFRAKNFFYWIASALTQTVARSRNL